MKFLKNIKYTTAFIACAMLLNSCEEYIEEDIFSDITSENFIDEDTADQLIVGVYGEVRSAYSNYTYKYEGTDIFTSQNDVTSISAGNDYVGVTAPNTNGLWSSNYDIIAKANTAINRYETQISWSESRLGEKAYGIAQARALRGLAFFNLVQQFGGVVLDLEETLTIRSDYTRSTEAETYAQIIEDLEAAIPNLEDAPEPGRFSKRAAQHVLAEVYLSKAYLSFGSSTDFSTAATLAEQAIGSYDIRSQSYAEVFDYNNQVNDEVLFATQFGAEGIIEDKSNNKHSLFMYQVFNLPGISRSNPYGFKGDNNMPTPFFYSLFSENDSREDVTIHRALIADEEQSGGIAEIAVGDTIIYFPKVALDAVELADHLDRHWVYQPDQYGFGRPTDIPGTTFLYSENTEFSNFPIFKKFDDLDFNETGEGARDTFVFRVAGTHLIAAEAYLGAGNSGQALFHINRVRERATGVADEYAAITIDDILNERALELAGEDNRWAVLKRTGKLEERINLYNPAVVNHGAFDANVHLLRPIPSQELTLSPGTMTQNPGY
ncbi:RagB/SusD family nutrient uptake outer membrane protein [Cellulophaga sp. HaHaR_3_176]|uniref:RagB/SusD family nutrient uptake outer membrane protein n=1 Tax=Cellulophaga sp. HaHaR_3_176 TaxID=1942464 RepID=UPI001C1F5EBB|nr:RagB/SusD family nutrient uptake outer membrane protein [Cellulophaga sp. HaHaR_3_176]QWX82815.1 RagB/SusD family nutrient uptake outer membrane protein [Cellulophaga sp. HaHaR_3_176]